MDDDLDLRQTGHDLIVMPDTRIIQPGWYKNISNDDYHAGRGTSSSQVKTMIEQTGAHFHYNETHKENEETDTKNLGTAFHTLTMEPELFDDEIAIRPDSIKQRRGKDWDSFLLEANGRTIITEDQYSTAKQMANNVREHPTAGALVRDVIVESSIYWWYKNPFRIEEEDDTHYKEFVKCRPDMISLSHPIVVDLKSAVDASSTGFNKAMLNYYYHVSGAMYWEGVNQCEQLLKETGYFAYIAFVFIVCENFPPYEVALYELDKPDLEKGRTLYHRSIRKLHEARQAKWPGYPDEIRKTELPPWADRGHAV